MAEVTYTNVVWTTGDFLTEAKLDSMVANDRAVDAMYNGVEFTERSDPDTPGANKIHLYAKDKNGVPALYAINDAGSIYEIRESQPTFIIPIVGTMVTGTSLTPIIPVSRDLTIVKAYAVCKVAPQGADVIIDINKNGVSIWGSTPGNRLTIAANSVSGSQTSFDVTSLEDEDGLTVDIDQVGSTTNGEDLSIYLRCK